VTTATLKAHCPRCDGDRICEIHGTLDQPWSDDSDEHSVFGQTDHRLLQCRGCEAVFYWQSSWCSEDWDVNFNRATGEEEMTYPSKVETYPAPEARGLRPDWTWELHKADLTLGQIMGEMYQAAEARSYILASIGLRTGLDRVIKILEIETEQPMMSKVQALLDGGWVGETEKLTLDIVADAGNAAAHRGWSPSEDDFRNLLRTMEQFIERVVMLGKRTLAVAPKIPAKPPRAKQPKSDTKINAGNEGQ
jgi:hypothetical protein